MRQSPKQSNREAFGVLHKWVVSVYLVSQEKNGPSEGNATGKTFKKWFLNDASRQVTE